MGMQERVENAEKVLNMLFHEYDQGRDPDWGLARGLPGVCVDPLSWEDAVQVVNKGTVESLSTLGRHPLGIKKYRTFVKEKILSKYVSEADYLLAHIFSSTTMTQEDGKLKAINIDQLTQEKLAVWKNNDFPYNFVKGIEHHLLWATYELEEEELEDFIKQYRDVSLYEYVVFVNPPVLKSIPSIWHAHAISRKKKTNNRVNIS